MTNDDDILSDNELGIASGGRGTISPQPVTDKRKPTVAGSSTADDTITSASGIVIGLDDDDGSSAPAESEPDKSQQETDADGTMETRSGIVMELNDDGESGGDESSDDISGQQKAGAADSSIRTQSGAQINLDDNA